MSRMFVDCREIPSESDCTIAISADSAEELTEAAVQHAVAVHGHVDGDELRAGIKSALRTGEPSAAIV
jgi:predicted small metal-binding protein